MIDKTLHENQSSSQFFIVGPGPRPGSVASCRNLVSAGLPSLVKGPLGNFGRGSACMDDYGY